MRSPTEQRSGGSGSRDTFLKVREERETCLGGKSRCVSAVLDILSQEDAHTGVEDLQGPFWNE